VHILERELRTQKIVTDKNVLFFCQNVRSHIGGFQNVFLKQIWLNILKFFWFQAGSLFFIHPFIKVSGKSRPSVTSIYFWSRGWP